MIGFIVQVSAITRKESSDEQWLEKKHVALPFLKSLFGFVDWKTVDIVSASNL